MALTNIMPVYQAVLLALVQGLTEFLPVSSSAHLSLAPWLLRWPDQGLSFDIALHVGTLAAVLIYFARDWIQIAAQGFGIKLDWDPELTRNPKLLWMLAAASLPIGLFGYFFKHLAETSLRDNKYLIGVMLIGVGLLLGISDNFGARRKSIGELTWKDAIFVGLAQAIAIVPGTSRSGITLVAGLFRDANRAAAARFSFLLSTPAILAAGAKDMLELHDNGGIPVYMRQSMAIGVAVSAVTGCVVIALFMRFLRSNSLNGFVIYRVMLGVFVLLMAFFRG